jgi:hypothetical protein
MSFHEARSCSAGRLQVPSTRPQRGPFAPPQTIGRRLDGSGEALAHTVAARAHGFDLPVFSSPDSPARCSACTQSSGRTRVAAVVLSTDHHAGRMPRHDSEKAVDSFSAPGAVPGSGARANRTSGLR